MNLRAIALVRTNFRLVTETTGGRAEFTNAFFGHLFGEHPEMRQLFPASMDQVRERFVAAICFVMDGLDDLPTTIEFLEQLGRDHRKYGVESTHYAAAANALRSAMRSMTGDSFWTTGIDNAWRELSTMITHSMAHGADTDDLPAHWDATVVEHRRVLDDLAIVRLQCDSPIPYEAGQYLSVRIPQRPRMWRYLSPAIPSNTAGEIEFHVRKISGGWVSPSAVADTQVGDRWSLGPPLGGLRVNRHSGDVLMIGCGTGIAPLRAQVMEMAQSGVNPHVHFFVGGHHPCDLYDMHTMWQLAMTNPWLTVTPVCEVDVDPWWYPGPPVQMPRGLERITGPIGEVVASFGDWADRQIQIAGSPAMVEATIASLVRGGTPIDRIEHDPV